jgi:hypothetical protein
MVLNLQRAREESVVCKRFGGFCSTIPTCIERDLLLLRFEYFEEKSFFAKVYSNVGFFFASRAIPYGVFPPLIVRDALDFGVDCIRLAEFARRASEEPMAVYNLDPIREMLTNPALLNLDKVRGSGIKLRLAVVGLESGALRYVDEHGALLDSEGRVLSTERVDVIDAVLASAAIPGVFPAVDLAGETYVDGGVREPLPARAALNLGADTIYAISATRALAGADEGFGNAPLTRIALRAVDIIADETLNNEVDTLRALGARVFSIRPTVAIHDTLTIDPGLIQISIGYGYMVAADTVGRASETRRQGRELADRITELRMKIWDMEHDANGRSRVPPRRGSQLRPVPDPEALREVRRLKRALSAMVVERAERGGPVRRDADTWWLEWEKHPWASYIPDPWGPFGSDLGEVEAEDPPGAIIPPVLEAADMSWLNPLLLERDGPDMPWLPGLLLDPASGRGTPWLSPLLP